METENENEKGENTVVEVQLICAMQRLTAGFMNALLCGGGTF